MPIDWSPFVSFVQRHNRFLLTTHVRPDGDGLGSMLALANALESLGKSTRMVIASVYPPRYDFLDRERRIQRYRPSTTELRDAEAIIVLDTGTWNQLGDFGSLLRELNVPRLVIDHHVTQDDLGALQLIDTTAEATGRLVFEAITALGIQPDPESANCLLVALAMDTGWFRHGNTTSRTYELAAKLVEAGANPTSTYAALFEENSLGKLRLTGLILGRLQVCHQGKICHTEILKGDYAEVGAVPQDSEDLVNYTRSVAGVEVGLFFMEQPTGGIKVSFRSRSLNVARIAQAFGGGGHPLASGAIVEGSLEDVRSRVLDSVTQALDLA